MSIDRCSIHPRRREAPSSATDFKDAGAQWFGMPYHLVHGGAVVWARDYSDRKPANCKCEALAEVLRSMPHPAERMVMGHTIQRGINAACDGKALRVDVGMSSGCRDARPEVRISRGMLARVSHHTPHTMFLPVLHVAVCCTRRGLNAFHACAGPRDTK
jgi:hypothetical protein